MSTTTSRSRPASTGPAPRRTCVGCRKVRPQAALLRLVRTPAGRVEPDPGHRREGRGAYLCYRPQCLAAALRRGAWSHAFRAPTAMPPDGVERARAAIEGRAALGVPSVMSSVEGGW